MIITQTWLQPGVPDTAIELAGHASNCSDRSIDSAMTHGGGLCVYTNTAIIGKHCSRDLEFFAVKCRPREFSAVVVIAIYIPQGADITALMSI